ncbi:MAG: DinB family protein [Anaerolineales bacterium]|nr:DinB family protein [Anaerolineales bacterium]
MPIHPLVTQLRFARSELVRCLEGLNEADATRQILPMNSISWMVGHLANQETRYWVRLAQGISLYPELNDRVGYGKPPSTPLLKEMWELWREITAAADVYLDTVTPEILLTHFNFNGKPLDESVGTMLMRNIYHYWYHIGEASAVRQMMWHQNLPEFVGDMSLATYQKERSNV